MGNEGTRMGNERTRMGNVKVKSDNLVAQILAQYSGKIDEK